MPSSRDSQPDLRPRGGSGTYLSTKGGFDIPAVLTNATVTCIRTTASVDGYIKLQGRLGGQTAPKGWYNSIVTLTCVSGSCAADPLQPPYVLASTNLDGKYELVKSGPGSGVVVGTYLASVTRRGYLGATKASNVTIAAGTNTINTSATAPTLLGGDWTGIDGKVDIGDLSGMGGAFGTQVTGDTGPDINGDTWVNIFDLTLAGGNYEKTSSNWP